MNQLEGSLAGLSQQLLEAEKLAVLRNIELVNMRQVKESKEKEIIAKNLEIEDWKKKYLQLEQTMFKVYFIETIAPLKLLKGHFKPRVR